MITRRFYSNKWSIEKIFIFIIIFLYCFGLYWGIALFTIPKLLIGLLCLIAAIFLLVKYRLLFMLFVFFTVFGVVEKPIDSGLLWLSYKLIDLDPPLLPSLYHSIFIFLILAFIVNCFFNKIRIDISSILSWKFIIFLVLLATSIATGNINQNDKIILRLDIQKFLFPVLYYFICISYFDSEIKIKKFLRLIFGLGIIKSIFGIIDYLRGGGFLYEQSYRVVLLDTADQMIVVTLLTILFSLMANKIYSKNAQSRLILFSIILMIPLIFSFRRHAWLGMVLSSIIVFYFVHSSKKLKLILIGALVIALFFISTSLINNLSSVPSS
jgi:hypothetical protein